MNCIGLLLGVYFGPAPLVVWRPPNSTHIQTMLFRAPGAAVLNTAALAAKSSAESRRRLAGMLARKPCVVRSPVSAVAPRQPRRRSALVVLVVAAPPDARLVAPLGGAVEPLVHGPEAVQSARIGGIGVVDDAVLERERAHARPLARVRGHVGSGHGREGDRPLVAGVRARRARSPRRLAPVVVEPVRDRRAGGTPRHVVGPEHEVGGEELRPPSEAVCQ